MQTHHTEESRGNGGNVPRLQERGWGGSAAVRAPRGYAVQGGGAPQWC